MFKKAAALPEPRRRKFVDGWRWTEGNPSLDYDSLPLIDSAVPGGAVSAIIKTRILPGLDLFQMVSWYLNLLARRPTSNEA